MTTIKINNPGWVLPPLVKQLVITIALTGCFLTAIAQYYPSERPVSASRLSQLKTELKSAQADPKKVPLLLNLSNLYFNKPIRSDKDLAEALAYAQQAAALSVKLHDASGFNQSQQRLADIFSDQNKIDDAERILAKVNDTTRLNLLIMLGYKRYLNAPDINSKIYKLGLQNLNDASLLALKLHNSDKERWAKTMYAYLYFFSKPKEAEVIFNDIVKDYASSKLAYTSYFYLLLTRVYSLSGRDDKALATDLKGIESMRIHKDTLLLGDCMQMMAVIYSNNGQHERSIDYCEQALTQYKVYRGELDFISIVKLKTKVLQHLKKNQEALAFLLKSMKDYPPKNNDEKNGYLFDIGKCYEELKDYKMAEKYLVLAYNGLKKTNALGPNDSRAMAEFYVRLKQYERARPYLEKFFKYKAVLNMAATGHAEYMAFLVDSAAGNYKSAMAHLAKNKFLDNQMLSEKKNHDIADLAVKYETAKKDGKISLLTQKAIYEAANAKQANLVRNLLIAGIFLVLVIAALLYRQNRSKQKNNEIVLHKNKLLERLVAEKEWLLKEVHHRVKNNLHTVICLLESQAAYLENDALAAIESSQHRIYAMSLIHQKLYQSDDIKTIEMDVYLKEFLQYLEDSYGNQSSVKLRSAIESIKLGVAQAIPVGLIINEAVTNSFKYAFPDGWSGYITIELHQSDDLVELLIRDNGIGMNVPDNFEDSGSLGMELMKGLTKDLKGDFRIDGRNGVNIRVLFESNTFDQAFSTLESIVQV